MSWQKFDLANRDLRLSQTSHILTINISPTTRNSRPDRQSGDTDCGPQCRNRLHELHHPKEEEKCGAGQVLDIWGYCRSGETHITGPAQHLTSREGNHFN